MKLGISTYTFPWWIGVPGHVPSRPLSAFDLLRLASEYKLKSLQFGDNLPLHLLPVTDIENLVDEAGNHAIGLEVGTRGLKEQNLLQYLKIAQKARSPFLRVVIDDADFHPSEKEVINIIKSIIPAFRQSDVVLAIENHDRFPAQSLKHIIQQTDADYVGICLDTANSLGAGEGINEIIEILAPHTVNLHIKDFKVQRLDHKMGFLVEGCAAGKGTLNIKAIIDKLEVHKKCRSATLEIWSVPEKNLDETLRRERSWAEESIQYLKGLGCFE